MNDATTDTPLGNIGSAAPRGLPRLLRRERFRILFATDGSTSALDAARLLACLPHARHAHVHILTVAPQKDENASQQLLNATQTALGSFPGHVTTRAVPVSHASTESVSDCIRIAAALLPADLVVVGTHGRSAAARFFLGSVAEAVARQASCPVLVGRTVKGAALDRVVVGMDRSDAAANALAWMDLHLPLPPECSVCLAGAVPIPDYLASANPSLYLSLGEAAEASVHQEYDLLCARLNTAANPLRYRGRSVETLARMGSPVEVLLSVAREQEADLVVVGAKRTSGLSRLLLGSVSEGVLRHAPCSVLIVPNRHEPEYGEKS